MKYRNLDDEEAQVDAVLRLGYYVVQYSLYHYRFQDAVDFWPSTGRWFDRKGYGSRRERKGSGLNALIKHMRENYPLDKIREKG